MQNKLKILFFAMISLGLFGLAEKSFAADPILFFSDIDSGPKTGWEGSTTKGAAISVWGKNLGTAGSGVSITVAGVALQSTDSTYIAEWNTTGSANGIARGMGRITFWLNSSMTNGAGTIRVTTSEGTSNALPFTIRSFGNIYFIDPVDGNNSYNGLYSTHTSGLNGPWKDAYSIKPTSGSVHRPGDFFYFRAGTYTTVDPDQSIGFICYRDSTYKNGTAAAPYLATAYPGEVPTFNLNSASHGFNYQETSGSGETSYWTFSKLKLTGGSVAFNVKGYTTQTASTEMNFIGNWMDGVRPGWNGVIDGTGGVRTTYSHCYGNYFYNCGSNAYGHNIYYNGADGGSENHIYLAYNEFDSVYNTAYYGGIIDLRAISYVYIHHNYFHGGADQPLYLSNEGGTTSYLYFYQNLISGTGNHDACFHLGDIDSNSRIINNTIYNCGSSSSYPVFEVLAATQSSCNAYALNNVIYGHSGQAGMSKDGSCTFNSNYDLYYNASVPSGSGVTVANQLTVDPLFTNAGVGIFTLQSSSLARDSATSSISSILTSDLPGGITSAIDYNGITVPQGSYDRGAFEYYTGGSDTTPPAAPTGLTVN